VIEVRDEPGRAQLIARVPVALAPVARMISTRLRALFDLDAHPAAVAAAFAGDRTLAAQVRRRPGLRVPGAFDTFELAIRAVLGQQVSVRGATTLAARLGERMGEPLRTGDPLARAFPDAARLAKASPEAVAAIGMPVARGRAVVELARAVAERRVVLDRGVGLDNTVQALDDVPGIGPWTAQYVAMRALRWPDAFPAGDLGVRKALAKDRKSPVSEAEALRRAEAWRPWRAYAVLHLWNSLSDQEAT
jgi:AraC family transcriptional regulator of adaptative response / DNA-3-methyladenine glycosylase II